MRVLVTGACGFYGFNLASLLLQQDDVEVVYGVDNFSRGTTPLGMAGESFLRDKKFNLVYANFQELTVKQINNMAVDVIYHLAAYNSGEESMETPEEYFLNNDYGTLRLLNTLVHTKNRPLLVFASTLEAAEGGSGGVTPAVNHPMTVMTATKMAGEFYCRAFFDWYRYPIIIIRNPNTYGEFQNLHGYAGVVATFIKKALLNEAIIIYNNGEQTRDFIYIEDAVKAYAALRSNNEGMLGQVLYLDGGERVSVSKLAQTVKELTESSSETIYLPGRTGALPAEPNKALPLSASISWDPQVSLAEGLKKTVAWQKEAVQKYV